MGERARDGAVRGTLVALASALAFGLTTPLVQRFGQDAGSFATAGLLYLGASLAGLASRSRGEVALVRGQLPRVLAMAIVGAGIAPVLLAFGLARTSGVAASLMLNLEAVFTVALARVVYREHVGGRIALAAAVLLAGGSLLVVDRGHAGNASVVGLAAVGFAAFAWAVDNAMAKPLSAVDPSTVVAAKGGLGAALSLGAGVIAGEAWPPLRHAVLLVVVGGVGYGMSLRLYLVAQRQLGAARTASVFAVAPFAGALLAAALGEPLTWVAGVAGVTMIAGVLLHLTERHEHAHRHDATAHEHAHRHDDGHHTHFHDPMPEGEHSHAHEHHAVAHRHAHMPDIHHEHMHDDE